jgi:cell wall-associated NlpC family hydrolase
MAISRKVKMSLSVAAAAVLVLCSPVAAEAKMTGTVTGNVVNFRQSPNLSSKILNKLTEGTKVNVIGSEGDWYKVVYSDATGWITSEWLQVRDEKIATGVVSGSVVNVRSRPDTSSEVLTKYEKGTKVEIYEDSDNWYRVSIAEGRYGWMSGDYVTVKDETAAKSTSTVKSAVKEDEKNTAQEKSPADEEDAADADENQDEAGEIPDVTGDELTVEVDPEAEDVSEGKTEKPDLADRGADNLTGEARKEALLRQEIVDYAKTLIGIKYVYGGESKKGFDCSGFVKYVYNHFDIDIVRKSSDQAKGGKAVKKADLQPGDLVFFDTVDDGVLNDISHVGIYVGDGKFIHASTYKKHAITIESLSSVYYSKRYMRARDYISK